MKIGIDARLYYESGVGRYIKNILLELDKYALKNKKHTFYVFLTSRGLKNIEFQATTIKKVKADVKWHSIDEQFEFRKILNAYNFDVMHFTYFSLPIFYKKKFIVTIHDLIINNIDTGRATTLPRPLYKFKRIAYKEVVKRAIRNSCFVISPSESTKKEILSKYKVDPEKISVIPEGIDPVFEKKHKKPNLKLPKSYILYVGNAYPHKNLERLIDAYKSIQKETESDLVLVGQDDFFYERLKRENKNKRIHFLNSVEDAALSYLYTNAEFLVSSSLMEGFGLTPLEAMSRGCLPVVSNIGAFHEVCGNAALYFNPTDIKDIAKTIMKALGLSKKEKEKYKKAADARVEKFSWGRALKQTIELYERCNSI